MTEAFDTCMAAVEVFDLTGNKSVYKRNEKFLLHPASNMKLFSTIAALINLPGEYNYKTEFGHNGIMNEGVIKGDLIVAGGADPDFVTGDLDTLILTLQGKGIRRIEGDLVGDIGLMDSLFWGKGWMWDDDPSTDAPYLTPLSINDNCIIVEVYFDREADSLVVRTEPEADFVTIYNYASFDSLKGSNLTVTRDFLNRSNDIIIKGSYDRYSRIRIKLNVFNPAGYFLSLLESRLRASGIEVTGQKLLRDTSVTSVSLYRKERGIMEVLTNVNKTSDNLSTELTLIQLGMLQNRRRLNATEGIEYIYDLIEGSGFVPSNYRIVDGSGVSHYNLVSTELINGILKYLYYNHPEKYLKLYETLPIAGVDGTLASRMKQTKAFNNVRAKTGTLSGVSCLSGYVKDMDNNLYSFSIMMQNHYSQLRTALKVQNEICDIIASYGKK